MTLPHHKLPLNPQPKQPRQARSRHFFFSSSLAVDALWHGPDSEISGEKGDIQRNWPVPVKGKSTHKTAKSQTRTTRKSPSQTCVSSPKQQSNKTNGARPNKKHPQMICRKIQRHQPLYQSQKHAAKRINNYRAIPSTAPCHLYRE